MLKRLLFYQIQSYFTHKNAIVITGMRQVGKTTLMRQIFDELKIKTKLWFDLDNPLDQKIFEDSEYRNIYSRLKQMAGGESERLFIFIDEIQNYPAITKVIKYLIDHFKVKFFVTGSSNFYLKNLFPESLSGRKFLYQLPPLNFKEYLYFRNKLEEKDAQNNKLKPSFTKTDFIIAKQREADYEEFMEFGGFPEVVTTADRETKKQILKNIFASFFEKDLKILSDYKDVRELRDLILLLAPRIGNLLDVSKIASELSIDRPKVYGYLDFLQGVFFIKLLPKFSRSIDRTVAGGKKIYFTDNGILNTVAQLNEGQILENAVINQLASYGEVSFYQKNGAEIDAILNKAVSWEIKNNGTDKDYLKIKDLNKLLKIKSGYVISRKLVEKSGFISPAML